MPDSILFLPECHVDTALARTLLYDRQKLVNHIKGVSKVGEALAQQAERYGSSRIVIALVDNDKRLFDVTKLKPFDQVVLRCEELGCLFIVYQHQFLATQYLVVLNPACDGWIYGNMQAAELLPDDYNVPVELAEFIKQFTKKKQAEERPEIIRLLKALRSNSPPAYALLANFVAARLQEAGHVGS